MSNQAPEDFLQQLKLQILGILSVAAFMDVVDVLQELKRERRLHERTQQLAGKPLLFSILDQMEAMPVLSPNYDTVIKALNLLVVEGKAERREGDKKLTEFKRRSGT